MEESAADDTADRRETAASGPQISVILPCFNAAHTLPDCLEGLLAQEIPNALVEIIVIDNNSQDAAVEIVRSYPSITLLRESTQGAYAARNTGVRAARGDVLAFIDPDCIPRADWLRQLTFPFHSSSRKIAIGRSMLAGKSLAIKTLQDYEHIKDGIILGGTEPKLYYGHTNNMAIRREVFDTLGPFVERLRGGDVVCVRKCVDHWGTDSVEYVPNAEVLHLEINDLAIYFRKVFTYGWSHALYSQLIPSGVAPTSRRWDLFRSVGRDCDYSPLRQLLLLGLMGVEGLAWHLGSRRGRVLDAREPNT